MFSFSSFPPTLRQLLFQRRLEYVYAQSLKQAAVKRFIYQYRKRKANIVIAGEYRIHCLCLEPCIKIEY